MYCKGTYFNRVFLIRDNKCFFRFISGPNLTQKILFLFYLAIRLPLQKKVVALFSLLPLRVKHLSFQID